MALAVCLVIILAVSVAYCGSHKLQHYLSMISAPIYGMPEYSFRVYVDGLPVLRYKSDVQVAQFLVPSLNNLSEHLEIQTKVAQIWQIHQERKMKFLIGFLNKTSDRAAVHVYQRKFTCELHENRTIGGYQEFALNGKELISFDKDREVFVAATQEAVNMLPRWNKDMCNQMWNKMYLENECIEHMKLYLSLITTDLKKKVKPKVKVSSSESESGTKLHCWVYGFYPRDVEVKWIKNGRDEIYSEESAEILPNPDGTYQIRVSVEVTPEEGATYSCHVDHSSLENPLVTFERKISHMTYRIVAAVAVAILFALALFLCIKMKGFECSRQSVRTEEQDYNQ
ncbi:major histocompatibility complex class I-related gene protein-like isoform X2 [Xenopus laevis]|uniref:Major histocompatibility complex class I-related gene protein-like isoform X2 n=1 Tax=Xenopus laevis TaxID=8355 RepID=A0A8J1LJQ0_XENLA|nr:major histocompatibility complex class I-related gene protein-like isoform X2 [Xenopus laevis]